MYGTSSRLDQITAFVDELEAKSNDVYLTATHSASILSTIASKNHTISQLDDEIDHIRDAMGNNYTYLKEFTNLYEKAFYIESNLNSNDNVTNLTTFGNLAQEYKYLLQKLSTNDYTMTSYEQIPRLNSMDVDMVDVAPEVKHKVSLSNLQLKPIRCNSKKVYKKKSKYRLSGIFNINPIAYDDSSSFMIKNLENNLESSTNSSIQNTPIIPQMRMSTSTFESSTMINNSDLDLNLHEGGDFKLNHNSNDEDDLNNNNVNHDTDTAATSPTLQGNDKMNLGTNHQRSSSLPEAHSSGIFGFASSSLKSQEEDSDQLRINRLKHFISFGNLHDLQMFDEVNEYQKSPTPSINLNSPIDLDNLSICSDISAFSPHNTNYRMLNNNNNNNNNNNDKNNNNNDDDDEDQISDNFENYLRKSRIDLHEVFPHILKKSASFDSIFNSELFSDEEYYVKDVQQLPPTYLPAPSFVPSYKIHNPIENIQLSSSSQLAALTKEAIYSRKKKRVTFEDDDPKRTLSDIILGNENIKKQMQTPLPPVNEAPESPLPTTPSKSNFSSMFNFNLPSPSKNPFMITPTKDQNNTPTTNTIELIGKSLTESFMNLVNTTTVSTSTPINKKPPKTKTITPEKIKQMKKKTKPGKSIAIPNDQQRKRMPIRIPSGGGSSGGNYASSLTIGPNNTRIIQHGSSSVFRKPVMSRVSHQSLREALSQSLLDDF
ncbi:hypothetical protein DFJ63DRAFT_313737 [Scheffersomyces coipomensis]|uniref:uncharacterized protein n=1 Tax=Scheffersomyces coipomensis TaxID=1788519 RepID=UPI00315D7DDA